MSHSLNDMQLSDDHLASLYGRSLVEVAPGKKTPEEADVTKRVTSIKFLGNNAKNITILVREQDHAFLPEAQLAFVSKILGACHMNTGDVAIVNLGQTNHDIDVICKQLTPACIISFGIITSGELFNIENCEGISFLNAPSLAELTNEATEARQLKTRLWTALKQLFEIE